ncbi:MULTISPECIES: aa3-type cytochrome c oxidase subunit IV [unclassified Novosphingobium]|uniref:aa3-type cytochrome c oxidase subunit IV n=1 Tax=unclassified Novosphingobium TaxID=2644732 RepID=UPI002D1FAC85|nr:aa3-type cytochrome c oxidase subunit IV [Novosphingobium sp.]
MCPIETHIVINTLHSRGSRMASGNDMKMHESTYSGFTGLVKWGAIVTVLVTAFVIYMIAS